MVPVIVSGKRLSTTLLTTGSTSSNSNTYTFTNAIVTPRSGIVVVHASAEMGPPYLISGLTLGGASMSFPATADGQAIAYLEVSAGTYTLVISINTSGQRCAYAAWLLEDYVYNAPIAAVASGYVAPATFVDVTLDLPPNSVAFISSRHLNGNAMTWSSATEVLDVVLESTYRYGFASKESPTYAMGHTETVSWSGSVQSNYLYSVWR